MSRFHNRLWNMLVEEHEADTAQPAYTPPSSEANRAGHAKAARRRSASARVVMRRPMALTAGALGLAAAVAAAVVLIVSGTATTTPAYALSQNPDGSVSVTINDLQTAIPQLNARFKAMGIDVTVVPIEQGCPSGGGAFVAPSSLANDTLTFYPGRKYLAPGYWGILGAGYTSSGQLLYLQGAMKPPLPSCVAPNPITVQAAPTGTSTTSTTGTLTSGS
jgi:hypothetical protein